MQRLWPLQNHHFGSKNKSAKNISETNLQSHDTNSTWGKKKNGSFAKSKLKGLCVSSVKVTN